MKFSKGKLAVALGVALGVGMVGQASADVYGLSYLNIDDLMVDFLPAIGGAGLYTFNAQQEATLNGADDPVSGSAFCGGVFLGPTSCAAGSPTLSGVAQNAPPNTAATSRGAGDYTVFGPDGNYSNSEAEVLEATLTLDPKTHVESISESNLADDGGQIAQSSTNIGSNTDLNLTFPGGPGTGTLTVSFTADIDLKTEVTDGDIGIAQAASGATLLLQLDGDTLASWAPTGDGNVTFCAAGLTCTATETGPSLNNTSSSSGTPNSVFGSGSYSIDITGLSSSTPGTPYTLAFNTTTSTSMFRVVPVPSTVLLLGTGLLLGARATRRNKK